ncbi:MAG: EamA family transporter, partial [Mailhella sp.]|nr:EamA family transporter [Mailhella sp.]
LLTLMPWAGVNAELDMTGVFFAALAAVFWGTYIVVGRKAGTQAGASASAWGGLIGTLAALPWALWMTGGVLIPGDALADALPLAFFVGFAASALPYGLEIVSLRLVPPQVFGVLMSIEPAVAALFGFLLLGEALSFSQWAAIGMVIAASLLVTLGRRKD